MAAKWLNAQEMVAWRTFIETSRDLLRSIEQDLAEFGLDGGDYQLLAMLSETPEHQLRMCELADILRVTRGGLTRRMEGVVQKKLVVRVKSDQDKREVFAVLTAKGLSEIQKVAPHHVKSVRRLMLDVLTPQEINVIGRAFTKISQNIASQ